MRGGHSYHKKCHKCYVCSETNLHNAEVFKGVIFCSSCSQRIFQGCSIVRGTKNTNRPSRSKRSPSRLNNSRRRDRTVSKRNRKTEPRARGVIELARLAGSVDTTSSEDGRKIKTSNKSLELSMELALQVGKEIYGTDAQNIKKNSMEIGMTTDVTQELLQLINCPVVSAAACKYRPVRSPKSKHYPRNKGDEGHKNIVCSDLRIAELGASTEIANMALRKKSEQAVIIKSVSRLKATVSLTLSVLNQESDLSADIHDWRDSPCSTLNKYSKTRWVDRRIGSLLKIPYKCFKKNILDRSSLVSFLMNSQEENLTPLEKFKSLFCEEIAKHQDRGIKKLYPTINHRRVPYQMGWLEVSSARRPTQSRPIRRCKHFKRSHSYRCMRTQVMRLAGPTRSELAVIRNKIKRFIAPKFVTKMVSHNRAPHAVTVTLGCGGSQDSKGIVNDAVGKL